jgi:predicted translin family RNA/ssDNA-binding protein
MTKREQAAVAKQDFDTLVRERREYLNSISGLVGDMAEVYLTSESATKLKEFETKMKGMEELIGNLYHEMMVEERQAIGYTTYCIEKTSDGRINTLSRIIPVDMKSKYDELFPTQKMDSLPNVEDVDRFLRG